MSEINVIRSGRTISLAKFRALQQDLIDTGYELKNADILLNWECPQCGFDMGVDLSFMKSDRSERGFDLCLSCFSVTKLLFDREPAAPVAPGGSATGGDDIPF